jgi:hypothetical protein
MKGGVAMGARTNIAIKTTNDDRDNINVYLHWGGEALGALQLALEAARSRWDDASYFTRIMVDQLTKGDRDAEHGSGIYTGAEITHEEEYSYKKVDFLSKTVQVGSLILPFEEFLKLNVLD